MYCFIKRVSLWKSIWRNCETENNIWTQLWIVNGSSLCSAWNQLWFSFSTLVECIHWEYFTLFYVIAIWKKITLIAQFHAIIWMQNIFQLNSHSLILLVPLAVSLSIMNQDLHMRWNAAIVKIDPFFKSYFQWSSAIEAVFIVWNQRHFKEIWF